MSGMLWMNDLLSKYIPEDDTGKREKAADEEIDL